MELLTVRVGLSLTLLPSLGTIFLLLGYLAQPWSECLYLVLLYLVFGFQLISLQGLHFSERKKDRVDIGMRKKDWEKWKEGNLNSRCIQNNKIKIFLIYSLIVTNRLFCSNSSHFFIFSHIPKMNIQLHILSPFHIDIHVLSCCQGPCWCSWSLLSSKVMLVPGICVVSQVHVLCCHICFSDAHCPYCQQKPNGIHDSCWCWPV